MENQFPPELFHVIIDYAEATYYQQIEDKSQRIIILPRIPGRVYASVVLDERTR